LTPAPRSIDTAFHADFMGFRICGYGHVHVYAMETRPSGS
jgi:hypothetical protein